MVTIWAVYSGNRIEFKTARLIYGLGFPGVKQEGRGKKNKAEVAHLEEIT